MAAHLHTKRSFTGNHILRPASRNGRSVEQLLDHRVQTYRDNVISWTLGRGSVIWRIWPAVFLHTLFAVAVVTLSLKTQFKLNIPSVMLTLLGVVIGFVISYRASSGYDRYWMGRTCWSDLIRNSRTMGRLIWFHVPPRLTPKTQEEIDSGTLKRSPQEMLKVMAEKRMALDLVLGFSVALKHHLRGELGIYFEDLYHLVRPLHDYDDSKPKQPTAQSSSALRPSEHNVNRTARQHLPNSNPGLTSVRCSSPSPPQSFKDPIVPPINAYGTFDPTTRSTRNLQRSPSSDSSRSSRSSIRRPLLPSAFPRSETIISKISSDLIPFSSFFEAVRLSFANMLSGPAPLEVLPPGLDINGEEQDLDGAESGVQRIGYDSRSPQPQHITHRKHRPRVAGNGHNLPFEILRCLSEWCSVLEDRGTVPGTSMGAILGCVAAFEDNLSAMERILTTPLPFVYSVHIQHTVWIYLFFLPFQLVEQFGWYTIPGVAIAAFIYLGFLAAGEEIEQPFGYDDNDLDLDLFCNTVIATDIERIKMSPCINTYVPHHSQAKGQRHGRATLSNTVENDHRDPEEYGIVDTSS